MYIAKGFQYRVGIRRRFVPIFRKFWVVGHKHELLAGVPHLTLRFPDGSILSVPAVGSWFIKVYPEFESAIEAQRNLRANQEQPNAESGQ